MSISIVQSVVVRHSVVSYMNDHSEILHPVQTPPISNAKTHNLSRCPMPPAFDNPCPKTQSKLHDPSKDQSSSQDPASCAQALCNILMVRDAGRSGPTDLNVGTLHTIGGFCGRYCRSCSRCRRGRRGDQEALLIVALGCRGGVLWFDDNRRKALLIVTSDRYNITSCS